MRVLALLLGLAAVPAWAQAPEKPFAVEFLEGVDLGRAERSVRRLAALKKAWRGLAKKEVLRKVVFMPPALSGGVPAAYCYASDVAPPCRGPQDANSIVLDVEALDAFLPTVEDFYKDAAQGEDAVLFHELLHGWGDLHREEQKAYVERASGRLAEFDRRAARFYKKIFKIEAGLDREDKEQVRRHEERLAEARKTMKRKRGRLAHRMDLPQRGKRDTHALDSEWEYFAYGGEIYFYAAEPEGLLTEAERAWWKGQEAALRGL